MQTRQRAGLLLDRRLQGGEESVYIIFGLFTQCGELNLLDNKTKGPSSIQAQQHALLSYELQTHRIFNFHYFVTVV